MENYSLGNQQGNYLMQGALATAGKYSLNSWVVAKRDPAYPPMFSPLSVVFTVLLDSIFIGDEITTGRFVPSRFFSLFSLCHLSDSSKRFYFFIITIVGQKGIELFIFFYMCSLFGTTVVIAGLYIFLSAKSKEVRDKQILPAESKVLVAAEAANFIHVYKNIIILILM